MAAFGTTIISYNGVVIHGAVTRKWEQEIVYDASNTDRMYNKITMQFEGIVHSGWTKAPHWISYNDRAGQRIATPPGGIGPTSHKGDNTPIDLVNSLRGALSVPRQILTVSMNNELVLKIIPWSETYAVDSYRDLDNGPKPVKVNVVKVVAGEAFRVSFEVCVCIPDLTDSGDANTQYTAGSDKLVVSNRWSVKESLDSQFFMTRVIKGHMRLASADSDALAARMLVVPPLEQTFRRHEIDYTTDATGLNCLYQVTDKQVHIAAPWPAARMTGYNRTSIADGVNVIQSVSVKLQGSPTASKRTLAQLATEIIYATLDVPYITDIGNKYIVTDYSITDHYGEVNNIETNISVRRTTNDVTAELENLFQNFGSASPFTKLTAKPGSPKGYTYSPTVNWAPDPYGYESYGGSRNVSSKAAQIAMKCYLQDVRDEKHDINETV